MQRPGKVYTMDNRGERTRIYMAVLYEKPASTFEHFKHVGHWLGELDLKPNTNEISYEDYLKGMTNEELHQELLYEINRVKRVFSWFLNSYSCRNNKLAGFDVIDLCSKLGIR